MNIHVHLWLYLVEFFLELEVLQTEFSKESKPRA